LDAVDDAGRRWDAPLQLRIGLASGPVVGGVIGHQRILFDLWGDTVNTASRMESTSETDMIQVSQQVYEHLKDRYELRGRGNISVRGKNEMATYALISNRL